ncbi:MAG TPA: formylglycine-generating enzyme family protein [Mesotoga sp.]|mgnify:CR=1 FL=1|nr:formylglycine-generating enzyme family protein [Mesotoga sp.]
MNNEARKQLIEVVKRYGIKILDEPRKVEGLLKDFCGDCKKEIFSIVNALKERAGNDLMNSSKSNTVRIAIGRLSSKMQSDLGMSEEVAVWSIESIAIALGIMSEKEAIGARKAQVEQKPVETKTGATYRQDSRESEIKTSNGDELIYVEGGSFVMGDTWGDGDSDEKPTHKVELTYDFYVGKYPVTFEEYDRYCKETGATKPSDWNWGRGRRPVINVSWFDAVEYCNWLSEKEGLPIAYYGDGNLLDENRRKTEDITRVKGYRLLTEAEWEYAAKGGKTKKSMGYKYSGSNSPDSVAWYDSNSGSKTHEVGHKKSNELELYDMSGNVWEWCSDWYGSYSSLAQTNPYNNSGSRRVLRGGSWFNDATYTRVANRGSVSPTSTVNALGFRICRTVP